MGLSQDEFWRMTPVEFRREQRAAHVRHVDELRRDVSHAWHEANFVAAALAGKPVSYDRITRQIDRLLKPPSRSVSLTELAMLSDHLGIALRPISPEAKAALERLAARG